MQEHLYPLFRLRSASLVSRTPPKPIKQSNRLRPKLETRENEAPNREAPTP